LHKFRKSASKAGFATLALSLGALLFTATAAQAAVNANTTEFFYQGSTPGSPPVALTGTQASTQVFHSQLPSTGFGTGGTQGGSCADAGGTGATFDSVLVPEGTNLSALTYPSGNPQPNQGTALAPAGVNGYVAQSSPEASPPGLIATNYLDNLEMATLVATGRGADGYTVQGTQLPGAGAALIPSGQSNAQFEAGVVPSASAPRALTRTGSPGWRGPAPGRGLLSQRRRSPWVYPSVAQPFWVQPCSSIAVVGTDQMRWPWPDRCLSPLPAKTGQRCIQL
jgi:hypothetical protein